MTQVFDGDEAKIFKTAAAFERLWPDEDFKLFLEFIQESIDVWGTQVVMPAKEPMDLVRREYEKGVFFGLRLAQMAKSNILSARDEIVRRRGTQAPGAQEAPEPETDVPPLEVEKGAP
jgi:hypothetical protein